MGNSCCISSDLNKYEMNNDDANKQLPESNTESMHVAKVKVFNFL